MDYKLIDASEQISLFSQESPDKPKRKKNVPIYRVTLVREGKIQDHPGKITSSLMAADLVNRYLEGVDREHFVVLLLDRKNQLIGINTVSIGSLTASVVHPREVYKVAILSNAAAIICAHNHPSGDPQPSQEDRALTARLVVAGKLLGIDVLDHIIVGDESKRYFSFADEGLLQKFSMTTNNPD
jgi:DNA repair protein RadC